MSETATLEPPRATLARQRPGLESVDARMGLRSDQEGHPARASGALARDHTTRSIDDMSKSRGRCGD
jgi:hypothetical protein